MSFFDQQQIEVLLSQEVLQQRIAELAQQIVEDYRGKDLLMIGVLKGAFLFLADLMRKVDLPAEVDFLGLSSYGSRTQSRGVVRITSDLTQPVEGRDVLVIEDIVDTGLTMNYLMDNLNTRRPASLRICALLDKPERRLQPVEIDYLGFTIPNRFVLGYGLDYQGKYRNLPYIGVMEGVDDD